MKLRDLAQSVGLVWPETVLDSEIVGVVDDSRRVEPGSLFVTPWIDGRDVSVFIQQGLDRGAAAVLSYQAFNDPRVLAIPEMPALHKAIGALVSAHLGHPGDRLHTIGITGTNGKTTTAWIIQQVLQKLGLSAGYLGTLGYRFGKLENSLNNTTPFSVELLGCLAEMVRVDVRYLAMEVSSHSLHQHRVAGIRFDVGVFTNLSQDHLDYHGTIGSYAESKRTLFTEYGWNSNPDFVSVLNVDDPFGQTWSNELQGDVSRFSLEDRDLGASAHGFFGEVHGMDWQSIDFSLHTGGQGYRCRIPLGGWFNAQNALAALAAILSHPELSANVTASDACEAVSIVQPVPGRFESVPNALGFGVIVDYAHTPDGLVQLLRAVRPLTQGRVITVFGCGGDRDRTKRPKMASVVSSLSDVTVVTSDNPRTEDPVQIFADIVPGLDSSKPHVILEDRREAIHEAIRMAEPHDVVVIAGKGHETYQIIGKEKLPFDDRVVARQALEDRA